MYIHIYFCFHFIAQVNEYKYEIERVNRELQDVKRKYYQQKRREQLMDELDGSTGLQGEIFLLFGKWRFRDGGRGREFVCVRVYLFVIVWVWVCLC